MNDDGNEGEKQLKHFERNEGSKGEKCQIFLLRQYHLPKNPTEKKGKDDVTTDNPSIQYMYDLRPHKAYTSAARQSSCS